jgi:tetratricopeptide (TPR) repeat protein
MTAETGGSSLYVYLERTVHGRARRAASARRCRCVAALAVVSALVGTGIARAHPALDDQLAAIDRQVAAAAGDGQLVLERAELHRQMRQLDAALSDCARAQRLGADADEVALVQARVLLDALRPQDARAALDAILTRHPERDAVRLLRAQVAMQAGDAPAAALDYARALSQMPAPQPDHYLGWARALSAEGKDAEAVQQLDRGLERLGPLPLLQLAAIDLEVRHADYAAALRRLDVLLASAPQPPDWLARRGEVLELAGRHAEAHAAYGAALAALQARSPDRRRSPANLALEHRLHDALRRLVCVKEGNE